MTKYNNEDNYIIFDLVCVISLLDNAIPRRKQGDVGKMIFHALDYSYEMEKAKRIHTSDKSDCFYNVKEVSSQNISKFMNRRTKLSAKRYDVATSLSIYRAFTEIAFKTDLTYYHIENYSKVLKDINEAIQDRQDLSKKEKRCLSVSCYKESWAEFLTDMVYIAAKRNRNNKAPQEDEPLTEEQNQKKINHICSAEDLKLLSEVNYSCPLCYRSKALLPYDESTYQIINFDIDFPGKEEGTMNFITYSPDVERRPSLHLVVNVSRIIPEQEDTMNYPTDNPEAKKIALCPECAHNYLRFPTQKAFYLLTNIKEEMQNHYPPSLINESDFTDILNIIYYSIDTYNPEEFSKVEGDINILKTPAKINKIIKENPFFCDMITYYATSYFFILGTS